MKKTAAMILAMLLLTPLLAGALISCQNTDTPDPTPSATPSEEPTATPTAIPTYDPSYNASKEFKKSIRVTANPRIADTKYASDVIVADYDVTDEAFGADPTGVKDSTAAIQNAIYAAFNAGGGTVYMPAGTYIVSRAIEIKAFVTLVGDCSDYNANDLKVGGETMIYACVENTKNAFPALFTVGGSAGIMNLRIFYPEQDENLVKTYPYTILIPGHADGSKTPENYMLSSVVNVSVVNAYRGIAASETGAEVNEQMNINGFYGTVLNMGLSLANSADASTIQNIDLSSKMWAAYGADESKVQAYMSKKGTAMQLGDVEWGSFIRCRFTGYNVGIHTVEGKRAALSATFYGLDITAAEAVKVDAADTRAGYGIGFSFSKIKGSIANNSVAKVSFTACELDGEQIGSISIEEYEGVGDIPSIEPAAVRNPYEGKTKPTKLTVVGKLNTIGTKDNAPAIQAALDETAAAGGGIVYLPNGYLRIDTKLNVPANVELRGRGTVPARDEFNMSLGTMLFLYCGADDANPETDTAAVTLGENAGVRNVRMIYPEINTLQSYIDHDNTLVSRAYMVRGTGDGSYVYNCAFLSPSYGVEFTNCRNPFAYGISICGYRYNVHIQNCQNAYVGFVLNNVTVSLRHGLWNEMQNTKIFPNGWEASAESGATADNMNTFRMMMDNLTELSFENSTGFAESIFSYSAKITLEAKNSTVDAIALGRDCYYLYTVRETNPTVICEDQSHVRVFNLHRFNGVSYRWDNSGSLDIFNRVTIYENERSMIGSSDIKTVYVGTTKDFSESMEIMPEWTENEPSNGSSSLMIVNRKFAPLDLSEYAEEKNAYIYVEANLEDATKHSGLGFFEICSGGDCDCEEWAWGLGANLFQSGDNTLKLYLKDGTATGGDIDWTRVDYIRMYIGTNGENTLTIKKIEIRY